MSHNARLRTGYFYLMGSWIGAQRETLLLGQRREARLRSVGVEIFTQIVGEVKAKQLWRTIDAQQRQAFVGEIIVQPIGSGYCFSLGSNAIG